MKKLLITGINGFIGSYCAKYFAQKYEIFGLDLFGKKQKNIVIGEVDTDNLNTFKDKFDVIIHLAGTGAVRAAQQSPEVEFTKTVTSTEHLLDFIVEKNPNAKIIYVSSSAVYGNSFDRKIEETDLTIPVSNYGMHKLEAEKAFKKYEKRGLRYQILRLFSVYGEGLKKQVLWDFSNRIMENFDAKSITCFGTGKEQRDFIHVKDVTRLIELAIDIEENGTILNGATGIATENRYLFEKIKEYLDFKGELLYDNIESKSNPKILTANVEKARVFGFIPKIKIEEGLKNYVKWFKEQY